MSIAPIHVTSREEESRVRHPSREMVTLGARVGSPLTAVIRLDTHDGPQVLRAEITMYRWKRSSLLEG